eukprot:361200-Chlamydomonas_euryale.AAC.3
MAYACMMMVSQPTLLVIVRSTPGGAGATVAGSAAGAAAAAAIAAGGAAIEAAAVGSSSAAEAAMSAWRRPLCATGSGFCMAAAAAAQMCVPASTSSCDFDAATGASSLLPLLLLAPWALAYDCVAHAPRVAGAGSCAAASVMQPAPHAVRAGADDADAAASSGGRATQLHRRGAGPPNAVGACRAAPSGSARQIMPPPRPPPLLLVALRAAVLLRLLLLTARAPTQRLPARHSGGAQPCGPRVWHAESGIAGRLGEQAKHSAFSGGHVVRRARVMRMSGPTQPQVSKGDSDGATGLTCFPTISCP